MNNSLIIREEQTLIEQNLEGSIDYQTLYLNADFDISDTFLSEVVKDIVNSKEYKNIFIPLCFGPIMSDFNGLRLTTHIRCTPGINQNKNIYIFSFVDISLLLNHECFDILKTKGVDLIKYNFHKIQALVNINDIALAIEELPIEIKKLNLQVPANYEDNHSVANEWAIYRWSNSIDANDSNIEKITDLQNNNLYFKYLKTIYPISHLNKFNSSQLKINYKEHPKVLYIDDEAEKGWYEIFRKIIVDENKLFFRHLDDDFNEKSKEEIIDISLKKVIDEDFDLVILDFRLHKDDFENISITEVTGYKILKKIKKYNKGIQVIIFSATNKIWNLQALHDADADGFIIKESPENNIDPRFTTQSIQSFISTLNKCINSIFLKVIRIELDRLKKLSIKNADYETFFNSIDSDLEISFDLLTKTKSSKKYFSYSFLQLFQIIENYISNENVFIEGDDSYVKIKNNEVCVQVRRDEKIEKSIKLTSNGKYEIQKNQLVVNKYVPTKRLDTNFKVSAVLIYKYGNISSSVEKWTDIYKIRNTKAAHYNTDNELDSNSIIMLINFIRYFIDSSNENDANISKGLPIKTDSEKLEILKSKYTKSKKR